MMKKFFLYFYFSYAIFMPSLKSFHLYFSMKFVEDIVGGGLLYCKLTVLRSADLSLSSQFCTTELRVFLPLYIVLITIALF